MSNYTRLAAESMRTISGQWLHDATTRAVLEKHPKTAVLVPDITEAHDALCLCLGGEDPAPLASQLVQLRSEGAVLDLRHDRKYRGSWNLLSALIELADKPETVESLTALRDRLHPNGLLQVNATWSAEAGNAATVREALDKGVRAQLRAFTTAEGRTLDDEVHAWVKAGEALGPIAAQKAAVEHQIENADTTSSNAALNAARLGWIKIARAIENNLDLVKGLTTEERSKVLGLLQSTAAAADRQRGASRKPAGADKTPADTSRTPSTT